MKSGLFLVLLLSTLAVAYASSIAIADPVRTEINAAEAMVSGKEVDLGLVGPGQKLEVVAQTGAGELSRGNESGRGQEADWDVLEVVEESLPNGWRGQDSLRFETPMKAIVVVGRNAPDGQYDFLLKATDDFDGAPPLTFKAKATVSSDVLEMRVAGEPVKTDPATNAVYQLELFNKGSASDVFEVRASGVPKELERTQTFFVPHNSRVKVDFPVRVPEAGEYRISFKAVSLSSDGITSEATATLFVGSSLLTDLKAAARGVLLFPGAEQIFYSLLALIGSFI